MKDRIRLFGVQMDAWTTEETICEIGRRMAAGHFTQHVVVNVAKLIHIRDDPELAKAVESCDIINIDGAGIVLGGRLLGLAIPERVAGIDLFESLLNEAENQGWSIFLLGGTEEVAQAAARNVRTMHPMLKLAGVHHGYFWDDEEAVVREIRNSGAEMLFVGISSPKKEQFIDRWRERLGVRFAMGVGGTFDIMAGKVRRAPKWMQRFGLEWLYRVIQEPRRMWRRYLVTNVRFAKLLIVELGKKLGTNR
jgi:N-acetylglucosaminyldiphosphoundecaprenol N-acetyl-beta-D-mannosaminyltransferase